MPPPDPPQPILFQWISVGVQGRVAFDEPLQSGLVDGVAMDYDNHAQVIIQAEATGNFLIIDVQQGVANFEPDEVRYTPAALPLIGANGQPVAAFALAF